MVKWWKKAAGIWASFTGVGFLYTTGALINSATGGKSPNKTLYGVITNPNASRGTTFSVPIQGASGYYGSKNAPIAVNGGTWGLPGFNPAVVRHAGNVVRPVVREVVTQAGGLAKDTLGALFKELGPVLVIGGVAAAAVLLKD